MNVFIVSYAIIRLTSQSLQVAWSVGENSILSGLANICENYVKIEKYFTKLTEELVSVEDRLFSLSEKMVNSPMIKFPFFAHADQIRVRYLITETGEVTQREEEYTSLSLGGGLNILSNSMFVN